MKTKQPPERPSGKGGAPANRTAQTYITELRKTADKTKPIGRTTGTPPPRGRAKSAEEPRRATNPNRALTTPYSRCATASAVTIQTMGKISIRAGDKRYFRLGPPRQRALFALLLINAGKSMSIPRIIDSLWGAKPPASVRSTIYSYISRLRQSLDETSGTNHQFQIRIRHLASGYMLETDLGCTDFVQFQDAIELASELMDEGHPNSAKGAAESALSLWHGTPYDELTAYSFAALEATRLDQLRLRGLQIWADAALKLHQHDEVIERLGEEVRRNPMQERLAGRLMLAQYHSGQPAKALLTYEHIRSYLAAELGVDASTQLQKLHQAVLRKDLSIGEPVVVTPDTESTPTPTVETPTSPLPPADERLVGRRSAMARLRMMAEPGSYGRVLLVVGEQGVGKTFLLQAFERELLAAGTEVIWARGKHSTDASELDIWGQVARTSRRCVARPNAMANDEATTEDRSDPAPERRPSYEEVHRAIDEAGRQAPIALFLEDIHCTDSGSLHLLHRLIRETRDPRFTVIATVRDHAVSTNPELQQTLSEILQEDIVDDLLLTPFPRAGSEAVITSLCGMDVSSDEISNLHRLTGGNPFLLTRMALSLTPEVDSHTLRRQLPFRVKVVVRGRLAECPPDALAVVEVCAVIGTVVEPRLLSSVLHLLGVPVDAVHSALRSGLIRSCVADNNLTFAQELVRDLVLTDMSPTRRVELHHLVSRVRTASGAGGAASLEAVLRGRRVALNTGAWGAIRPILELAEQAAKRLPPLWYPFGLR